MRSGILLLIIILLFLFLRNRSHTRITVGMYDEYARYATGFKKMTLDDIYTSKERVQYKSDLTNDNEIDRKTKKIADEWKAKLRLQEDDVKYTLRICSPKWTFKAHFDCEKNYVVMLDGSKDFLLFDLFDHEVEEEILEQIETMDMDSTIQTLDANDVKWEKKVLRKGDTLIIDPRVYHMVHGQHGSTLLNITMSKKDTRCEDKFDKLWSKQNEICQTNKCLY